MKKINIDVVKKYINGENLEEYTLEQLENDKDFMIEVINYTNDLKIYNLCSDNVRNNYDFVKYLIFKFKNNYDFIRKVADNFLNSTNNDLESKELNIIMSKILPSNLANKYKVLSKAAYSTKRVEIEIAKAKDPNLNSIIGMGFWSIFDSYNNSKIILDYYAECLLNEIIKDNNINFEKMLHNQFKTADKIKDIGINNYIINFIDYYDSMLSSYISTHLNLINNLSNQIKKIQINWDKYNSDDEKIRYLNMIEMVHEYMDISESKMLETDILYYVAKELGINKKVSHYDMQNLSIYDDTCCDLIKEEIENSLNDDSCYDLVKYQIENSLKEKLVYLNIKKVMINQVFSDKPVDLYSLIGKESQKKKKEKSKCKIIKFIPNNNS